jgi:hypothetical protein
MEKKIGFRPAHIHTDSMDSEKGMLPLPKKAPQVHTGFTRIQNSVMGTKAYDEEYGFGEIVAKHNTN